LNAFTGSLALHHGLKNPGIVIQLLRGPVGKGRFLPEQLLLAPAYHSAKTDIDVRLASLQVDRRDSGKNGILDRNAEGMFGFSFLLRLLEFRDITDGGSYPEALAMGYTNALQGGME
jgi:hypothetical protein